MVASHESEPTLNEDDAWRIALAWQEVLQERVRLVEADQTHHIVSTYAWVALRISGQDDAELLYTFKAASTIWFALSCCRGYSGHENPSFWKRVFGKLREPRVARTYRCLPHFEGADEFQHPVTDAARFFDEDRGLVFPRIQLCDTRYIDEYVQAALLQLFFHGQETLTPRMVAIELKMAGLLDELMVYVISSRSDRSIPVSLRPMSQYDSMDKMLDLLLTIPDDQAVQILPISVRQPRFALHSIDKMAACGVSLEVLERWKTFLQTNRLEFSSVVLPSERSSTTATLYQTLLGLNPAAKSLVKRGYCMEFGQGTTGRCAEPMWSALPQARTFESLVLHFGGGVMDAMNCSWIGYALFHPDTPRSSWSALELQMSKVTMENVVVLEAMAKGNNLFAMQTGLKSRTTTYSSAQLRNGAVIQQTPRVDGEVLLITSEERFFDATRVLQDDITRLSWRPSAIPGLEHFYDDPYDRFHGQVVDDFFENFSQLPRNNLRDLSDWICVIVPTYGIGWVLASSILRWTEHVPSVACLKSLTIDSNNTTSDVLVRLLALVGANLRMLDIGSAQMLDSKTLDIILRHCPSLETLCVCHDGSLWADDKLDPSFVPQLKSLALRLPTGPLFDVPVTPSQTMNRQTIGALAPSQVSQPCPPHDVPGFGALLALQVPQPCPPYCIPDMGALFSPQVPQPPPTLAFRTPSPSAATTILRDLEALRLEAYTVSDFVQSRTAVQETLQLLPALWSFHFRIDQNASKKNNIPLSYSEGRAFTWSQMGEQDVALPPFLDIWIDNDGREAPLPWE